MKILILTIFMAVAISAQNSNQHAVVPEPTPSVQVESSNQEPILRAQLEVMQKYNDRILSTVYWSLGILVAVAVLLVGYSWFANYKLYERDRSAIVAELNGQMTTNISQVREKLESEFRSKSDEISNRIQDLAKSESEKAIQSTVALTQRLTRKVADLEYEAIYTKKWYWETEGVAGNVLSQYLELLPRAINLKSEVKITDCLNGIHSLFKKNCFPFSSYIPGFMTLLDSLPKEYSHKVKAISDLLEEHQGK